MAVVRTPTQFTPPGVFIAEDILGEFGLTQDQLAKALGVSRRTVNQLVNDKRAVTADMALRLGRLTNTSPQFWLNLQSAYDLARAQTTDAKALKAIKPLPGTSARAA